MKKHILLPLLLGVATFTACKKDANTNNTSPSSTVADNFDYSTTREIETNFNVKNVENQPDRGVKFEIYTPDGERKLFTGATDANGAMNTVFRAPSYLDEVMIRITNRIGLANGQLIPISGKTISGNFGGNAPRSGKRKFSGTKAITPAGGNWYFIGTYDSQGVPDYLESSADVVDAAYLNDISSALPEFLNIPVNKPTLLAPTNSYDVVLTGQADVWITFIGEGAGALNTFGYYKYDPNNPPTAANQIDSIFCLFPNASRLNSGGGLQAGDKIKLGNFPAGTGIGWVMLANGWNASTQTIKASSPTQTRFYSTYSFNPEGNANLRQHNVQLVDANRKHIIVGFEDIRRDFSTDNDFNDFLMYVTVSPFSNVDITNIPQPEYCTLDDDGDGVANCDEDYRNDPDRAFDNYTSGTLAYEDLWPGKGDYDFNDLVVDYLTNQVTNASNNIKDIKTTYTLKALGGELHQGFGVKIDGLSPSAVQSVSGSQITQGRATLSGNGTEAGQSDAVIIVYDEAFDHMQHVSGESFINTIPGNTTVAPAEFQLDMTMVSAVNPATIGLPPYNPFLFLRDSRHGGVGPERYEVHLPDMEPTDKVFSSMFGEVDDDSDPNTSRYYKTQSNLPWALHIDGTFDYPSEKNSISDTYLNFNDWATSGGLNFSDWYLNLQGYRDGSKVY
ncbi:MAG TPA: hypothetical protein DCG19_14215 [Cryomorphaceae bacterium]|nr:hypothetical protein [Owenweeksia sp.]MBF99331.1 hypothetical protein [Owenweeksia sp.]HAD98561.1 hypothetical protein [Cryomorphaceae bacterium]|tara:strand:- start:1424 stop:3445 length:2022 start_codon:yes stop_codon:yes gene_type:complete